MSQRETPDQEPTGPFVGAAFLCEQVLKGQDGVLSAIRIVDRVNRTATGPDAPTEMQPFAYKIQGLVLLKDGAARGRHEVSFRMEEPSGIRQPMGSQSVQFEGGGHGTNIEVNLALQLNTEGLYWIDVLLDGRMLTRIPLEVRYAATRTLPPP